MIIMTTTISKLEFDNIIKKAVDSDLCGFETQTGKYETYHSNESFMLFIEEMKTKYPDIYSQYADGKGDELKSHIRKGKELPPKMASVASSSRFCYLALRNGLNSIGSFGKPVFEQDCRITGIKGNAPQLDAYFPNLNTYFEVKCHEILDKHTVAMKYKYKEKVCGPDSDFELPFSYEALENYTPVIGKCFPGSEPGDDDIFTIPLREFGICKEYSMFDIKQLICHLLGIASNNQNKSSQLIYLFFKPKCSDASDQKSVDDLFYELKKEITAIFSSYPIQNFCRKYDITLRAWAEFSEKMTSLTPNNRITLY